MADIRPPSWPTATAQTLPQAPAAGSAARTAAQRAFFDAALAGQGVAPKPAATAPAAAQAAPRAARAPDLTIQMPPIRPTDEPPQKILRPGSIIDIRV